MSKLYFRLRDVERMLGDPSIDRDLEEPRLVAMWDCIKWLLADVLTDRTQQDMQRELIRRTEEKVRGSLGYHDGVREGGRT